MKLTLFFVTAICSVLVSLTVYFLFRMGMPLYTLSLLVVPVGIYFMNHPKVLYAAILCTPFSRLTFPGLPSTLYIYHLLCMLALGLFLLEICLQNRRVKNYGWTQLFGALFTINVLIIIAIRGAGLRVLGDSNWGGMRYAEMLLPLFLIFLRPGFVYTSREWKWIGIAFIGFSMLPLISEVLFLLSGGTIYHQFYLVRFNMMTAGNFAAQYQGQELVRFQTANRVGPALIVIALSLLIPRNKKTLFTALYILGALLIGVSGHRSGVLDLFILTFIGGWFYFRKTQIAYFISASFAGVVILLLLYQFAIFLPHNFQRALMILPGIEVSRDAYLSAMITVDWRLDLWKEALYELGQNPVYLFLGKGLTYSYREFIALTVFDYDYWWAILTSNYHQGFLSLIIVTGIPGIITCTGIFLSGFIEQFHIDKDLNKGSSLYWAHRMILVYVGVLVVKFFVVYGDVTSYLPLICHIIFGLYLLADTLTNHDSYTVDQY